jgi:acyl carrier protein
LTDRITVDAVATLVRDQLGAKADASAQYGADDRLEDLGLSSLDQTEVFFAIEQQLGFELDPTRAADVKTLGGLVEVVNQMIEEHDGGAAPASPEPATTA